MFTIMLDLRFKSLEVVENYVGHEELIHLTFEYFIYLFIYFDGLNPQSQTFATTTNALDF